jgi:hypothetical protein
MSYLNALLSDLRDKKLWPLAVALLAGLVAVPVLLSKSPAATPPHPLPSTSLPVAANTGTPVVVNASPGQVTLSGKRRDPFTQQAIASKASTSSCAARFLDKAACAAMSSATSGSTGGASPSGSSSGTTGSGTTGSGTTGSGTTVSPVLPVNPAPVHHASAPSVFTSRDAYHVSLAITNAAGGVNAVDPLLRDSELPSNSQPLLVEVGVLKGGKRAIFYVQPGSVVGGPGTCIPGPVDCEILSLGLGQTESVKPAGSSSTTLFQVTDIYVDRYATAAEASLARAHVDGAGRHALVNSTSSTLALFQYDPALDAVVDLRNLTVGG